MDLKIFFSPISESVYNDIVSSGSLYKNIHVSGEKMPEIKGRDIALIGLEEVRGAVGNQGAEKAPDEIRKKLYNLKKGYGPYNIVDLGNLRNGVSYEETCTKIKEVCRFLLENNIVPVLFGGTHDLDYGQYQSYEEMNKLVTVLNVDASLDMEESTEDASLNHIQKILLHTPNYLFHYSHLAYQSYLVDNNAMAVMEKLYFDTYRIGQLRHGIEEMEPVIRNADMMTFDVSAIRSSDAPGNDLKLPFGLTGEEACQICWYAGLNEKMSSIGFYGYDPDLDEHHKTGMVIATMVWYFIEGFYHRKKDMSFTTNDYLKYVVSMDSEPATINFYKSKLSEKWWLEVPYPDNPDRFARNCIIPCSYADYEMANQGEVPERYINMTAKLS